MKLAPEVSKAIDDLYEIASVAFGDPPGIRWEIVVGQPERFGVEVTLFVRMPGSSAPIRYTITAAGIRNGVADRSMLIRIVQQIKRNALDWRAVRVSAVVQ